MLPACARKVYVRLPKNCTEAPAHSAGNRAAIGVMPARRMHAENSEKSIKVAPLPTTNARTKRSARSVQRSASSTFSSADHTFALLETSPRAASRKFAGLSRARDERALRQRTVQIVAANRDVQLAVGAHDLELTVLVELSIERVQEFRLEAIHFDVFDAMDRPRARFTQQQWQFDMREQSYPLRRLAGLVQTLRGRRTDVNPGAQHSRRIAHGNRRFFRRRETAFAESNTVFVVQAVGQGARHKVAHRLGRV